MAETVRIGGGEARLRSFWAGLGLSIVTLTIYGFAWYFLLNEEQRLIGIATGDKELARVEPAKSLVALVLGALILIPGLVTVFNFCRRIERAEQVTGIPPERRLNPKLAFLLLFPGAVIVVPAFVHYWYVTQHQNAAIRAAARVAPAGAG